MRACFSLKTQWRVKSASPKPLMSLSFYQESLSSCIRLPRVFSAVGRGLIQDANLAKGGPLATMGGSLAVAYTKKLHGGFLSVAYGGYLYLVCAICDVTIWRHVHAFKLMFWRSVLTRYAYSSTQTPLNLFVIALNTNYQRSRLGYRREINPTLQYSSL